MNAHHQFKKGFSIVALTVLCLSLGAAATVLISYFKSKNTGIVPAASTTETKQVAGQHFIAEVVHDGQYIVYVQGNPTSVAGPKGLTTDDEVTVYLTEEADPLVDSDEIIELTPAN